MKFSFFAAFSVFAVIIDSVVSSNVIEVTDKDFDKVVLKSGKHSLVEFYADWCGHCKQMAPTYDELADSFFKTSKDVQIVKINADKNRKIGDRYDIQGFPTLKFFNKKDVKTPIEYEGGRDLESLQNFVTSHTGARPFKVEKKSNVVNYDDNSFEKNVIDDTSKSHLVAFTASWCGHCKKLHPVWEQLADIYQYDNDTIIISEILTSDSPSDILKKKYNIGGFPTILFFSSDDKQNPIPYKSGRDLDSFINYINEKTGAERTSDGKLTDKAGLILEISKDIKGIVNSNPGRKQLKKLTRNLENLQNPSKNYYIKLIDKILNDQVEFFEKESNRLTKILGKSKDLAQIKVDSIQKRLNILNEFLDSGNDTEKESHDEL
ncbi:hypothetical protein PACTADRAFT_46800 [Pachysolen tannophilus NRRL Y-2460]|uniref:protein disulfide-isomerase n=1 Tax=Pachysolen tannophilus NRRL Y-2460 TaxID=669874 RepID=A0A1E4TP45_PACTA|nr:hypothetical protein PACTADRAFT_46800 [Pachysolen tannophilus NRRL Y-2460]